jgi:hypothetical protein
VTDEEAEAPDRAVLLDGDAVTNLLQTGEVDSVVFEPDGEEGLRREEVHVVSMAGPHPLFDTTDGSTEDTEERAARPFWKRFVPQRADLVSLGIMGLVYAGTMLFVPEVTLAINGEPATIPPSDPTVQLGGALIFAIIWYLTIVLFTPDVSSGGWSA